MNGENSDRVGAISRRAKQTAIPLATLSVSAWAENYRHLPRERADQSGRWRNEVVPYLVELMNAVGKPGITEIIFVKSSQVGGSEFINNVLGYFIHIEPCPILFVAENEGKAEAWSKESLTPTIRDTPVLRALVGNGKMRDSNNTIEGKSFPGGHLAIAWATSPATLSSRPRRVVLMDERDAFQPTKEGDPARLAEKRTVTFRSRKVIIKVSTPRDRLEPPKGSPPDTPRYSPIELEYENSDKRKYFVPCPHCGEYQTLTWKNAEGDFNIRWDDEGSILDAYYVCIKGCVIEHEHKQEMLARGAWRAEKPCQGRAGFYINELFSPFVTWGEMAQNFREAKKNQDDLKVFVNTSLAEGWEDRTEQASVEDLVDRREAYELHIPFGVIVLTAGVDVQGNRLEVEIVGWGLDEESWSLDYRIIEGDPAQAQVWQQLETYLLQKFECEWGGQKGIDAVAVDTGGHHTQMVYKFCRKHAGRRFFAIKGANTPGKPLAPLKPTIQGYPPVRLYTIGTETAKDALANHLMVPEPGPGYCHFPTERTGDDERVYYGENYFKQLRSERPVMHGNVRVWQKVKAGLRNEALDVRVYAMAARAILNPNIEVLAARLQAQIQAQEQAQAEPKTEETPQPIASPAEAPRRQFVQRRPGNFATNWKKY
ncbi:MAG TPA: phage terminase large subunit family protein [Pyrinomonadaceae bacterium]|jgi:phage terminase large subunit GpA-like protein